MLTTLKPKILLVTLKYDFKVMQRENSPNEVQILLGVQTVQMGYSWQPWYKHLRSYQIIQDLTSIDIQIM